MGNRKQPEVRFEGFTEGWEEKKIANSLEVLDGDRGTNYPHNSDFFENGYTLFLDTGNVTRNGFNFDNVKYITKEKDEQLRSGKLEKKDFVLTSRGTLGNVAFYDKIVYKEHTKVRINSAMLILRNKDKKLSYEYLHTLLKGRLISNFMRNKRVGSAQPHITKSEFLKVNLNIPHNIDEQQKIGTFFKQLDDRIALCQRQLELLKEQKKGFLQKMFPKSGEKTPEVRFAGFTEEWEESKLGKHATIVRGASPRPIQDPKWFDNESDIGWLRISDVTNQDGRITYLDQHISKLGEEKTRVLTEPHLLLSIAATVGKPVVNYVKTGVHDGFLIFLKPSFDREFMFQWLEMFRPQWRKYGQPGSQVNLNSELVRNQIIDLPNNVNEQQKIGTFFKQLDDIIALNQKELDVLKETKKGFLQKMFV